MICSDKTGTLTLMEMMVVSAVTAESAYEITGKGYASEGEVKPNGQAAGAYAAAATMASAMPVTRG